MIKQFRHFLRWLNRSPEFAWKRPAELELGQIRIPLSPTEQGRAARAVQVETYTPDELRTLWGYASPFQWLLMLLALNCGFGKAELASLELSEVLLRRRHPREREVGCSVTDDDSPSKTRAYARCHHPSTSSGPVTAPVPHAPATAARCSWAARPGAVRAAGTAGRGGRTWYDPTRHFPERTAGRSAAGPPPCPAGPGPATRP